jgi:eukaryotic-like serine/threonine-protein kinase
MSADSSMICPQCHTSNRRNARFCQSCGAILQSSPAQPGRISPASTGSTQILPNGMVLENRYKIEQELGVGGFGAVYKAMDLSLNRACAVKVNLDVSPEAQRQFTREATVLANLIHPNLPRVTDHFFLPGQGQFLVMDFIEGEDLEHRVQRLGSMTHDQAMALISQVADALEYMHTHTPPVVHRDVKPANIRLTPDGRAVLVDFGLVKLFDPQLRTTVGARAITPGYSPPEQYGHGNTDARSDVYALGATLYTLLTGLQPQESVQRVATDTLVPASQVDPHIPAELSRTVSQAMSLNPSQRFLTAGKFKAVLNAPPPPPPPIQIAAPIPRPTPKPRPVWPVFVLLGGCLILSLGVFLFSGPLIAALRPATSVPNHPAATRTPARTPTTPPITATGPSGGTTSPGLEGNPPVATVGPPTNPTIAPPSDTTGVDHITPSPTAPPQGSNHPRLGWDLAFASDRDGSMHIYLMDTQNPGNYIGLPNPPGYNRSWWPTYCGGRIATEVQDDSKKNPQWIYILDPAVGTSDALNPGGSPAALGVPRCSPDGTYMAISNNVNKVWTMWAGELSGAQFSQLYKNPSWGYASWPLLNYNFYFMGKTAKNDFSIGQSQGFPGQETTDKEIIPSNAKYPAISPDGHILAYMCNNSANLCIWDMNTGDTVKVPLKYAKIDNAGMPASAMWSADRQWIYFSSADGGDWDIFRIHPDGSGLENITADWPSNELMPALQW